MGKNGVSDVDAILIADDLRECIVGLERRIAKRRAANRQDARDALLQVKEELTTFHDEEWTGLDRRIVQLRHDLQNVAERIEAVHDSYRNNIYAIEKRRTALTIGVVIGNTFRHWWKKMRRMKWK